MAEKFMDHGSGKNPNPPQHPDEAYYLKAFFQKHDLKPVTYPGKQDLSAFSFYIGKTESGQLALFANHGDLWSTLLINEGDLLAPPMESSALGLQTLIDHRTGKLDEKMAQIRKQVEEQVYGERKD